jgi:Carboxypeptidase regulatory-like domain
MKSISRTLQVSFIAIGMIAAADLANQTAVAQNQTAGIVGVITDSGGAVIPNATITITSPALQVHQLSTRSDSQGNYKVVDLPAPGVYRITVSAKGFRTEVHDGTNLGVGFTAKIDSQMTIGEISQVVEVQSSGPVIDTVSTATTATLELQEIQESPKGLGLQELLPMAAGVSLQGKPDVGDSNLANRQPVVTYGVVLTPTLQVESVNTSTAKDSDSSVYLDSLALAEVEFKTSGNNAEVGLPGVAQVAVMKSGGNTFHGDAQGDYENPSFQGNNITPALAAPPNNLTVGNPLTDSGYYDYAGDIGGRIITDKLWFYGGYSKQSVTQGQVGFVGAPGTGTGTGNCWVQAICSGTKSASIVTSLTEYNYKVSYQPKPSTKLIFSELHGTKYLSANSASPLVPLPSSQYELQPGGAWHGEVQTTLGSRFLVDGSFGYAGYHVNYTSEPVSILAAYGFTNGSDFAGSPSEEELSNKSYTGPYPFTQNKPQNRYEMKATASYIPIKPHLGLKHQFNIGTVDDWEYAGTRVLADKPSGDYLLEFQNGVPNKIAAYNYPFPSSINSVFSQSGFLTDTLAFRRFVLNVGVRGERYHAFYPTQSSPAGQFSALFPAQTFQGQDILTWTDVVPRAGVAWDVKGNGKTVVKFSFGLFGDTMGDTFAATFNPNAQQSKTYTWTGPCQATAPLAPVAYSCDVTPAFLATLPSLTPTAATGGTSQVLNPGLKQDKTHEYTVKVERQLLANVSLNVAYVRHSIFNMYDAATNAGSVSPTATFVSNGIDVGHTYNVPVQFTDNFNGVATPVTVYTYVKGSGAIANEVVSTPSNRPDIFNSVEVAVTKRSSKRWNGIASFWMTKDHRWLEGTSGIAGSPNDDAFPIDDTWNWEARGSVVYNLPMRFQVSSFFRAQSGTAGQRLAAFNSSALSQGSTTLRMSPFGQYRGPVISTLNIKAAKVFAIHDRYHIEANFQVFNLLNSSAAVTTNYLTGASTFGVVSNILSPRVARIGGLFTF